MLAEPEQCIQIQTMIATPVATWQAWCVRCQAAGRDPVAVYNERLGPLVDAMLKEIGPIARDV